MLSQTTEYALRAVIWLAQHQGSPQTTAQISEATKVPISYLAKVLQSLRRASIVGAVRGLHGGFELAGSPETISILDIVNIVDPVPRIRHCPLGLQSHQGQLCPLHRKLDLAMEMVENSFRSTCLADLLNPEEGSKPLCETLHSIAGARA